VELHDATLHLISEVITPKASLTVATSHIKQEIREMKFSEWFETMAHLTREDSMSMRSPWIWRSVNDDRP
jgi:hypothetical protein